MALNKVILQGRVTRKPEIKAVNQTKVCKFAIAINRISKDKKEVDFFDIETWGSLAENCSQYLDKGSACLVEGRLKQTSWGEGEAKRYHILVVAEQVLFLDSKTKEQEDILPFPKVESMRMVDPRTGQGEFDFSF